MFQNYEAVIILLYITSTSNIPHIRIVHTFPAYIYKIIYGENTVHNFPLEMIERCPMSVCDSAYSMECIIWGGSVISLPPYYVAIEIVIMTLTMCLATVPILVLCSVIYISATSLSASSLLYSNNIFYDHCIITNLNCNMFM